MKKVILFATLACMMSCNDKTAKTPAIDPSNFDLSVAPNEDFYQYATGGWQAKNPLKPEFSRFGSFDVLRENNEVRINDLFQEMTKIEAAPGSVDQKISDLYKMGLDSVRLNKEGAEPVKADLAAIMQVEKGTRADQGAHGDDARRGQSALRLRRDGRPDGQQHQRLLPRTERSGHG